MVYNETEIVEMLTKEISEEMQMATQYGGIRPYAISLLIGGIDSRPKLFEIEPSAAYLGYKADAIGAGKKTAEDMLVKSYKDSMCIEDAISLGVSIIKKVQEGKLTENNVDISTITKNVGFDTFTPEQIAKYPLTSSILCGIDASENSNSQAAKGGDEFEIFVDADMAYEYITGKRSDPLSVLETEEIFKDARKEREAEQREDKEGVRHHRDREGRRSDTEGGRRADNNGAAQHAHRGEEQADSRHNRDELDRPENQRAKPADADRERDEGGEGKHRPVQERERAGR